MSFLRQRPDHDDAPAHVCSSSRCVSLVKVSLRSYSLRIRVPSSSFVHHVIHPSLDCDYCHAPLQSDSLSNAAQLTPDRERKGNVAPLRGYAPAPTLCRPKFGFADNPASKVAHQVVMLTPSTPHLSCLPCDGDRVGVALRLLQTTKILRSP